MNPRFWYYVILLAISTAGLAFFVPFVIVNWLDGDIGRTVFDSFLVVVFAGCAIWSLKEVLKSRELDKAE